MTDLEKLIIQAIEHNRHLSNELRKRYILAMFLMKTEKQKEFLELIGHFTKRCDETNRGIFVVRPNEMQKILRTYEEAKADILKKIQNNNQK